MQLSQTADEYRTLRQHVTKTSLPYACTGTDIVSYVSCDPVCCCKGPNASRDVGLSLALLPQSRLHRESSPHPTSICCRRVKCKQAQQVASSCAFWPTKASKKDSRPTCLDGLWEILQHAEELLQSQPDVMAHTLRLLAVMWQV